LLIEEGLSLVPVVEKTVVTPTGVEFKGMPRLVPMNLIARSRLHIKKNLRR
jgi:hypothetical protein